MQTFSESATYALKFINQTNRSVFLTGKAGTGKTTLLREIIRTTHKNTVVVAPTGIAALNAGGVTIHSMFQLPFATFIPDNNYLTSINPQIKFESRSTLAGHFRMSGAKQSVIRNMELLVIDEVSMLRPDLLDAMEFMLQSVRKNQRPFGGVQVLFIGDLMQLPPVIKNEEWAELRKYYAGKFFFHSHAVQKSPPVYIELTTIFRQSDDDFISILNNLRHNMITGSDVETLNRFVNPGFDSSAHNGYITLTTHNAKAEVINAKALNELTTPEFRFVPEIVGEFPEKLFPVEEVLVLKKGAQVMFVKNDPGAEKRYFNGKTGIVKSVAEQEILIEFPEENLTIEIERYEWKNIRYFVDDNTKEIREEVLGTFVHYPIKLAWAITVHKSQGLTFERAAIDVSDVFAPGQAYVALSRLTSLKGLVLLSPLRMNGISSDSDVVDYAAQRPDASSLESTLQGESIKFIHNCLNDSFQLNDLIQSWRNHLFSYNSEAGKSVKSNHQKWAARCFGVIEKLGEPANKFSVQLVKLFHGEPDLSFVSERINAAYEYFFWPMDRLTGELLKVITEVKRMKKTKAFYEELLELYEIQTEAVIKLIRARKLIEIAVSGQEITKDTMTGGLISNYRNSKAEEARKVVGHNANLLDNGDQDAVIVTKKVKKPAKKSTYLETYELWQEKKSVREISEIRKLTTQTIYNHLAKLISIKAINLAEILPQDKIDALAAAFEGYNEESLNALKEQYGNKFTWDELKLFKAANSTNKQPAPLE